MALKIRLARGGSKKSPFYRVVVADSRMPRDGGYIDRIGTYDPRLPKDREDRVKIDGAKAAEWIAKGAKPSDRVARLLGQITLEGADTPVWNFQPGSNPKKGEPGTKAKERIEERAEKEAARKQAQEEAKRAAAEKTSADGDDTPADAPAQEEKAEG